MSKIDMLIKKYNLTYLVISKHYDDPYLVNYCIGGDSTIYGSMTINDAYSIEAVGNKLQKDLIKLDTKQEELSCETEM